MSVFPKWLYHADCEPLMVVSLAQLKALGAGWAESPAEAEAAKADLAKKLKVKEPKEAKASKESQ